MQVNIKTTQINNYTYIDVRDLNKLAKKSSMKRLKLVLENIFYLDTTNFKNAQELYTLYLNELDLFFDIHFDNLDACEQFKRDIHDLLIN